MSAQYAFQRSAQGVHPCCRPPAKIRRLMACRLCSGSEKANFAAINTMHLLDWRKQPFLTSVAEKTGPLALLRNPDDSYGYTPRRLPLPVHPEIPDQAVSWTPTLALTCQPGRCSFPRLHYLSTELSSLGGQTITIDVFVPFVALLSELFFVKSLRFDLRPSVHV